MLSNFSVTFGERHEQSVKASRVSGNPHHISLHSESAECMRFSNTQANSVQTVCACTNKNVWAGQCQGSDTSTACTFLSFYDCGVNGTEHCQVPFASNVAHCPPSGEIPRQQSQGVVPTFTPKRRMIEVGLGDDSPKGRNKCAASVEAFNLWLAVEMKMRKSGGAGGEP